jgi:hypothetical protein
MVDPPLAWWQSIHGTRRGLCFARHLPCPTFLRGDVLIFHF